jgi:hypothetical protein
MTVHQPRKQPTTTVVSQRRECGALGGGLMVTWSVIPVGPVAMAVRRPEQHLPLVGGFISGDILGHGIRDVPSHPPKLGTRLARLDVVDHGKGAHDVAELPGVLPENGAPTELASGCDTIEPSRERTLCLAFPAWGGGKQLEVSKHQNPRLLRTK